MRASSPWLQAASPFVKCQLGKANLCDQEASILYLGRAEKRPATTMYTPQETREVCGWSDEAFLLGSGVGAAGGVVSCRSLLISYKTYWVWVPKPSCCRVRTSLQSSCLLWLQIMLGLHFSNSLWGARGPVLWVCSRRLSLDYGKQTSIFKTGRNYFKSRLEKQMDEPSWVMNEARGGQNRKMASKIQPRPWCTVPVYPPPGMWVNSVTITGFHSHDEVTNPWTSELIRRFGMILGLN